MRLKKITIQNYRSCHDITIQFGPMTTFVGANNAGKSCILKALDFFFNPSPIKINEESFWSLDTTLQIRIEGVFIDLTTDEVKQLGPYLKSDGTLHVARSVNFIKGEPTNADDESTSDSKVKISHFSCIASPKVEWLIPSKINSNCIDEWWKEKENLIVNGHKFMEILGESKPIVSTWKEKAGEFVSKFLTPDDYEDKWSENPPGFVALLKANLPHFILVPAVRDLSDEAKVLKSNPLGHLLYSIIKTVTGEQNIKLSNSIQEIQKKLNKIGGTERFQSIVEVEDNLNSILHEYMECNIEIEFQLPTLEALLTTPRMYADDGFRNTVENKGHGLQRAIIFSILRNYSQLVTGRGAKKTRTMIFAVEEPELYMHPQAQRTIRRVFQDIVKTGDQVMFSTHSPLLLDVAFFDEIVRVESVPCSHNEKRSVFSKIWQLPMEAMINDFKARYPKIKVSPESIRELYANAYHPTRAEGFFAKQLILVEGPTEQYSLPIYANAIGIQLDSLNIGVIDCGGKGPIDRLYRIFNELGIPCFILFDYDKDSKDPECIAKSKELLRMFGQPDTPPDKLLITDRMACFPHSWEEDLKNEISEYDLLSEDARKNLGLSSGTGKPLVARYIAKKLVDKNPPFIPPTLKQILEKAKKIVWVESCLRKRDLSSANSVLTNPLLDNEPDLFTQEDNI